MTLDAMAIGAHCSVVACDAIDKIRSKLEALGLVPGASLLVLQRTGAGVIVDIKSSRLALAHDLAKSITVATTAAAATTSSNSTSEDH